MKCKILIINQVNIKLVINIFLKYFEHPLQPLFSEFETYFMSLSTIFTNDRVSQLKIPFYSMDNHTVVNFRGHGVVQIFVQQKTCRLFPKFSKIEGFTSSYKTFKSCVETFCFMFFFLKKLKILCSNINLQLDFTSIKFFVTFLL